MKPLSLIFACIYSLLLVQNGYAQGIAFEKGNWKSVQTKAAAAGKLIYLDIYTTWCGPCKLMARNYFPAKAAGDFYNKNFVCYKLDAEAGEGIAVAKKYDVQAYPTNLFIDGKSGNVVFRVSGMPGDVDGFIENGRVALLEKADPMTLADYQKTLQAGPYDEAFLRKYLQKNKRLDLDNDAVIDAYIAQYTHEPVADSIIVFLASYQKGVLNNGYQFLNNHSAQLNDFYKNPQYWSQTSERYYNNSLRRATDEKNQQQFDSLIAHNKTYVQDMAESSLHYFKDAFYKATKNTVAQKANDDAYAKYIMDLSEVQLDEQNHKAAVENEKNVRWQVQQMGVDNAKIEENVKANMDRPQIKYSVQLRYAKFLNEQAWQVFQQTKAADKPANSTVLQATAWAKKAMELAQPDVENYVIIGDTYANLLYAQGQKAEAVKMEAQLIEKGKAAGLEDMDEYEATLKSMMH